MNIKKSKVVIIGAGNVGVSTAFCLVNQGICDEIALIDLNEEKVIGEVLDLTHCMEYMHRNVSVHAGTYDDCKDANIIVITASAPMPKNKRSIKIDRFIRGLPKIEVFPIILSWT